MTHTAAHAQSTDSVLMIRPARFYSNPETAADNAFQRSADCGSDALTLLARKEFDAAVQTLRAAGVNVHVFEDTAEPEKPDAVFPNNWISTHRDGRIAMRRNPVVRENCVWLFRLSRVFKDVHVYASGAQRLHGCVEFFSRQQRQRI